MKYKEFIERHVDDKELMVNCDKIMQLANEKHFIKPEDLGNLFILPDERNEILEHMIEIGFLIDRVQVVDEINYKPLPIPVTIGYEIKPEARRFLARKTFVDEREKVQRRLSEAERKSNMLNVSNFWKNIFYILATIIGIAFMVWQVFDTSETKQNLKDNTSSIDSNKQELELLNNKVEELSNVEEDSIESNQIKNVLGVSDTTVEKQKDYK